ncbi:CocE/NonD family hydrolase [Pseudomonas hefeiensis]|uniref:CocE/NonD family hydrolase n=1 Tax=Pseudomonas hefeiensis TaxID=2738125 RepID=A0ABY9GGZ9_9PSED|nr:MULTISPECIES: CocE/NonD family hydrolase [unclassified Pseudomonas]WLH14776.1 CocE/NonD family hydrolase [Pseudomonas sp. FP205]WLH97827.1 CocE/NonD family hydrolase [Pseudomonas sp. FP53]WLI42102.1 CocE/NonD family hydrolase [Pseudomonas sp. FP821]
MTTIRVGNIEVLFRPSTPVEESSYPGFNQGSYILPKGSVHREGGMPLTCDILVEQDVPIRLRDGVTVRTDVYRPVDAVNVPAIVGWSPYGKRGSWLTNDVFGHPTRMDVPVHWEDGLNKFEAPNPAYWVAHGYAVVAPDSRGVFMSEGDIRTWGPQEPLDEYDVIEWVGTQPWCNAKVGLSGNSMLAMSQWFVAALRPPHLAAIAPWEGASDIYRDTSCRGGIPEIKFSGGIFSHIYGHTRTEDLIAMTLAHPLYNDYWDAKAAKLKDIVVPAYIVASWTNILHTAGTLRGWKEISSAEKWLRVHNTFEWPDYYNPANVDDLRRFFDCYLKGIDNGWSATPRVRLTVLNPGGMDTVGRAELDFPLKREVLTPFFLHIASDGNVLFEEPQANKREISYDSHSKAGARFQIRFDQDTEVTGYMKLKLWVETREHDDMDVFAFIRKLDVNGQEQQTEVVTDRPFLGPNGRLRASLRAIDETRSTASEPYLNYDKSEKLKSGEVVPLEIGFWPYSMSWKQGETLELIICGVNLLVRPEFPQVPPEDTLNKGAHIIHSGAEYDSHLLIPIIPNA